MQTCISLELPPKLDERIPFLWRFGSVFAWPRNLLMNNGRVSLSLFKSIRGSPRLHMWEDRMKLWSTRMDRHIKCILSLYITSAFGNFSAWRGVLMRICIIKLCCETTNRVLHLVSWRTRNHSESAFTRTAALPYYLKLSVRPRPRSLQGFPFGLPNKQSLLVPIGLSPERKPISRFLSFFIDFDRDASRV